MPTARRSARLIPVLTALLWSAAAAADTVPPTVDFTGASPADGATVSGVIALQATAQDNVGVQGTQFRIDNEIVTPEKWDAEPPYELTIDTATLADGPHIINAIARDAANNYSVWARRTINVSNGLAADDVQMMLYGAIQKMKASLRPGADDAVEAAIDRRFCQPNVSLIFVGQGGRHTEQVQKVYPRANILMSFPSFDDDKYTKPKSFKTWLADCTRAKDCYDKLPKGSVVLYDNEMWERSPNTPRNDLCEVINPLPRVIEFSRLAREHGWQFMSYVPERGRVNLFKALHGGKDYEGRAAANPCFASAAEGAVSIRTSLSAKTAPYADWILLQYQDKVVDHRTGKSTVESRLMPTLRQEVAAIRAANPHVRIMLEVATAPNIGRGVMNEHVTGQLIHDVYKASKDLVEGFFFLINAYPEKAVDFFRIQMAEEGLAPACPR